MSRPTIAVIGAGFSGTMLSLWLQTSCPAGTRIRLIERANRFGIGPAYATSDPNHLLNVPAGRMSVFPDLPHDFVRWLQRQSESTLRGVVPTETSFVPRALYGKYLHHLLDRGLRDPRSSELELVNDEVIAAPELTSEITLHMASGAKLSADVAVLATGNAPPLPFHPGIGALESAGLWRGNPWSPAAFDGIDPTAPVLLVGTGLTMVDTVISLLDAGHTGPIYALSRHGLLPRRHVPPPATSSALPQPLPERLVPLMRCVRREIARSLEAGTGWHPAIDALRPITQDLWRGFSIAERERFMRHLRAWWDVHRHRMAPQAADRIDAARTSNQLCIHAGRIMDLAGADRWLGVTFRERTTGGMRELQVARVIDCTGPCADITRSTSPLMQALLAAGMARPDPLRLGLDVSDEGALLNRSGAASNRLFAVGPLTKGANWEITAVPDIRTQCRDMARALGKRLTGLRRHNGHGLFHVGTPTGDAGLLNTPQREKLTATQASFEAN